MTDLESLHQQVNATAKPPLHLWHPPLSGQMDMVIQHDGAWIHEGVSISRHSLVVLFSSILRRESDGEYYLVTPVEKWQITVADVPFIITDMDIQGEGDAQEIYMKTNVDDYFLLDNQHAIKIMPYGKEDECLPYVHIRDDLYARLSRSVYYRLMDCVVEHASSWGVWSSRDFFPLESME